MCEQADGTLTPFDRKTCWTAKEWLEYMMRDRFDDVCQCIKPGTASYTPGDPTEDGDAGSRPHPGAWLNYDAQGTLVGVIDKKTAINRLTGASAVDPPREKKVDVPSVCPTPGPSPTPSPGNCPIPTSCPNLITWGVGTVKNGVRNCAYMGANHVPTDGPVVGGFAVCDSTPRFGNSLPGKPCNDDSHAVCSASCGSWRPCEDPRGPDWSISGPCHLAQIDGFHVKIKLDGPGTCTVQAFHPSNPVDALGQPVTVNGFTPGSFSFNIH